MKRKIRFSVGNMYSESGPCFSDFIPQNIHNLQAQFYTPSTKDDVC